MRNISKLDIYSKRYITAVIFTIVLGIGIRCWFVFSSAFPLHDGGLFVAMIRDLQIADFHLPIYTTYNNAQIPYAYPPLAFYLAGVANILLKISIVNLLRFIPLIFSILSIGAFYYLAKDILGSRIAVVTSMVAFAILPDVYLWRIMGGGLTRSPGLFFALLAMHQAYKLCTTKSLQYAVWLTLWITATVLCHPETTVFLYYSLVVMLVFVGRHRQGIVGVGISTAFTAIITIPWWGTVVARHGINVFLNAGHLSDVALNGLIALFANPTNEVALPVWALLALLGIVVCLENKKYWLPIWFALVYILHARWPQQEAVIPISLLAGIGVEKVLAPLLSSHVDENAHLNSTIHIPSQRLGITNTIVTSLIIGISLASSIVLSSNGLLVSLSSAERQAMAWISENTPKDSKFLILAPSPWWNVDRSSEWFPVLTGRESIITDQGYEWLGSYPHRAKAKQAAQLCCTQGSECIDIWMDKYSVSALQSTTYIYIYILLRKTKQVNIV